MNVRNVLRDVEYVPGQITENVFHAFLHTSYQMVIHAIPYVTQENIVTDWYVRLIPWGKKLMHFFLIVMESAKPAMDHRVPSVIVVMLVIFIFQMNVFQIPARSGIFRKTMLFSSIMSV